MDSLKIYKKIYSILPVNLRGYNMLNLIDFDDLTDVTQDLVCRKAFRDKKSLVNHNNQLVIIPNTVITIESTLLLGFNPKF